MARVVWLIALVFCAACGGATARPEAPVKARRVVVVQIDGLGAGVLANYLQRPAARADDRLLARLGGQQTIALADVGVDGATAAAALVTATPPAKLSENTPTLFDLVPGAGIGAGFPAGKQRAVEGDDVDRVEAIEAAPLADFVAVRLELLTSSQNNFGLAPGAVLASIDKLAARLRAKYPDALFVVIGGVGAAPRQTPSAGPKWFNQYMKDQPVAGLAKYLKVAPETLRPMGGALWIDGLSVEAATRLGALEFNRAVFRRDAKGAVQIYDADLKAFRAVYAAEFPDLPDLEARVDRVLKPGQTLALAHRVGGFDYQAGLEAAKVARGGANRAESAIPVIFAGPMIRGAAPEQVTLTEVAELLRAARAGTADPLWQRLTARPTPPAGSDWARCRAGGDCAALVATATHPAPAADALVAAKAYAAARWLDPTVPLPDGVDATAPMRTPAKRYAFGDEPKGFTAVQIEVPSAAHAAMIARVTGADVVAWQDSAVVAVPHVYALAGPAWFAGSLMEADGYAAFARGVAALGRGDEPGAYAELGAAKGLAPKAEVWRSALHAYAGHDVPELDEAPEYPTIKGWPNVVLQALRVADGDEDATLPPLPMGMNDRQTRLYGAFARSKSDSLPCSQIDSKTRVKALTDVQARFEAARLNGFAAWSALERASLLADPTAARAAIREALDLVATPDGAAARAGIYARVLLFQITQPTIAQAADAELDEAAEGQLLQIQADIAADRSRGQDGVSRLMSLVDGAAIQRRPALVEETIAYAIDGQSKTAAAVVQALLASGGIASLLQPNAFQQLMATLRLMESALKLIPTKDGPDERVARAMPRIVKATLMALQGGMAPARTELAETAAMLPNAQIFAAREAAVRAAGTDGDPSIAAWGPLTKVLIVAAQGVAAFMADDTKAAIGHGRELVEVLRLFTRAELRRAGIKGFEQPIDALAHVLTELLRFAEVFDDPKQAKAATRRMLTAARAFPLDSPEADPEVRPWLRLAGVLVHDFAWLLAQEKSTTALDAPNAAVDALANEWVVESTLARAGLYLLVAAQHALPDLGKLFESEDFAASLDALPRVRGALKTMVESVRKRYPADGIEAALKADKVERIFIEHILHLAENPKLFKGDGLAEALSGTNGRLRAAAAGAKGDVRDVLLLIESVLAHADGDHDTAIRWAQEGETGPNGPAFAQLPAIWPSVIAGWEGRKGDRKAALKTLARAQAACPSLTHRYTLATAVHRAASGDKHGARKAFKAARVAARTAGNGGVDGFFQLNIKDESFVLQSKIQTALLGLLIGRTTGSFQLGAGGSSEAGNERSITWFLGAQGSPADAVGEALALEAWTALARGDEGAAGTALGRLMALMFGVDPRHFDDLPADHLQPMPTGTWQPRSMRMILWTAILAELHGFEALGGWLARSIGQRAEQDWPEPPGGTETVCARDLPDDASGLLDKLTCTVPGVLHDLLGADGAIAFEKLVRARMLAPKDMPAARAALAEALPTLLPRPSPGATALRTVRGGSDADATVREAIEAGYTCELTILSIGESRRDLQAKLLGETSVCGPIPFRVALVSAAVADGNATTILETLEAALLIDAWTTAELNYAQTGWALVRKTLLGDKRTRLAKRAAHWRAVAERLDAAEQAAWFEAVRIAASGDVKAAEPALNAAWAAGIHRGSALKFLKQTVAGQFDAARKELLP